jgi:transcription initiation factor TFIIH subunit 1
MTTCQTAANEFLRQFWSSIYPSAHDQQVASTATPTQRAAKAAKMISYLEKMPEKVEAILQTAVADGAEGKVIQTVS